DLTAYVGTKRPGDRVEIDYLRKGEKRKTQIELTEYETFILEVADLEITNADEEYLKQFNASNGVQIVQATSRYLDFPKDKYIIVAIDGKRISNVSDVKQIMAKK